MKKIIYTAIIAFFPLIAFSQNQHTNSIIVKLKTKPVEFSNLITSAKKTGNVKIDSINNLHNIAKIEQLNTPKRKTKSTTCTYVIYFYNTVNLKQVIDEYYKTHEIEYAEPNYILKSSGEVVPNDRYYNKQWALHNDGSFTTNAKAGADIDMQQAWEIEQGSSDVVVGIIDTGVKLTHIDFKNRIWVNAGEIPGNGIDDDNNGYIDDVNGWNFIKNNNNANDDNGHGTNVAGIIGANGNNTSGFTGIDWNCKIMPVKILDEYNEGSIQSTYDGIIYATDNGARVLNISLGTSDSSLTLKEAIDYALDNNVIVVACTGNDNIGETQFPAGFDGVIAVGATDCADKRSNPFSWSVNSGSNYGKHLSVVAPGSVIYNLSHLSDASSSVAFSGTSQAAPHVVGIISLLLAKEPNLTAAQAKLILESTAEDTVGDPTEDTPGFDIYYGHGRVNAFKALKKLSINSTNNTKLNAKVYPNPTTGTCTIELPKNATKMEISNINGQIIETIMLKGELYKNYTFNQNGIYFINIELPNHSITKKVMVY